MQINGEKVFFFFFLVFFCFFFCIFTKLKIDSACTFAFIFYEKYFVCVFDLGELFIYAKTYSRGMDTDKFASCECGI